MIWISANLLHHYAFLYYKLTPKQIKYKYMKYWEQSVFCLFCSFLHTMCKKKIKNEICIFCPDVWEPVLKVGFLGCACLVEAEMTKWGTTLFLIKCLLSTVQALLIKHLVYFMVATECNLFRKAEHFMCEWGKKPYMLNV